MSDQNLKERKLVVLSSTGLIITVSGENMWLV